MARARSTLKDFEILDRLGSGSFGTVYKVKRFENNGVYVIKTVRISELTRKEQHDAINEVKILAQLESDYVVRYYDSFMDEESLHIVMEYCNRGDLQSVVKRAKDKRVKCLKEHVTWDLTLQILLGLHYLHGKKILHRDLKAANVFLMKNGKDKYFSVKIGDLGVAKQLLTSTTFAQTIVGTPYYLSPELCADKPYRDKSDCWALGVLLYECCTLRHPFEARNQCALIMKIMQAKVVPPSHEAVSPELSALCLWLLSKNPEQRPTIKELLNENVVRNKLREHELPLPPEISAMEPTHHIQQLVTESVSGSSSSSSGGGGSNASTAKLPASASRVRGGAVGPTGPERDATGVTGNRVRGGGARAQRQPSKAAMERYQVKPTLAQAQAQAHRQQEQMHRMSGIYAAEGKEGSSGSRRADEHGHERGHEHELSAKLEGLSEGVGTDSSAEIKANDSRDDAPNAMEKKTDDGDYDADDFEEYESDFEAADVSGDSGAPEGDGEDGEATGGDGGDVVEDLGGDATQIKMLQSLVQETRDKSLAALGPELFNQVYLLCSEHMTRDINQAGEAVGDKDNASVVQSTFVGDLEAALCQQLKGGVEVACEAVFGVKVLLALEDKIASIEEVALKSSH